MVLLAYRVTLFQNMVLLSYRVKCLYQLSTRISGNVWSYLCIGNHLSCITMFCVDYICSFIFHFGINYGLFDLKSSKNITKDFTLNSYVHGACSGLLGALTIHNFDFVRQGAITSRKFSIIHSFSTVPFATVFFGLYFHQWNPDSLKSQFPWGFFESWTGNIGRNTIWYW